MWQAWNKMEGQFSDAEVDVPGERDTDGHLDYDGHVEVMICEHPAY